MVRRSAVAILAACTALAGSASAAPAKPGKAGGDNDVKCMIVASVLSQNQDPKARAMATAMIYYYMGRLDQKKPGADLGATIKAQAQTFPPTEIQAQAQVCITQLNGRARALQAISGQPPQAAPGAAAPSAPAPPPAPAAPQ